MLCLDLSVLVMQVCMSSATNKTYTKNKEEQCIPHMDVRLEATSFLVAESRLECMAMRGVKALSDFAYSLPRYVLVTLEPRPHGY